MTGAGASRRGDLGRPASRVGIAGLGLVGGSIALGLRDRWPQVRLTGLDRPEVLRLARELNAIDDPAASLADFDGCELVILATPVPAILELVAEAGRRGTAAVVTDVGSTKREIMSAAAAARLRSFVGGHPMAGGEQGGLTHATAGLFAGRRWMIVTGDPADERAVELVERLAVDLGAIPHRLDAVVHDRTMAYVSHLPQLVADALMSAAGDACGSDGLALAGRAFYDMTRVAASPADVWRGILATNADFVDEAVRSFLSRLPAERALEDGVATDRLFADARRWRRALAEGGLRQQV